METNIHDDSHLVRYCPRRHFNEEKNEISRAAFYLREIKGKKEESLSFDLAQFYKQKNLESNIRQSIRKLSSNLKVRNGDVFAVLDVISIKNKANNLIDKIIQEYPDKSHVGMYFDSNKEFQIATILSEIANKNVARK